MKECQIAIKFYASPDSYGRDSVRETIMVSVGRVGEDNHDEAYTGVSCAIGSFNGQSLSVARQTEKTTALWSLRNRLLAAIKWAREAEKDIDFDKLLTRCVAYHEDI